ncbi:MAG: hypothetical protein IPJ45_00295 [Ignavibacteria bacterium]|nr:hypothetical protein [Ignavibacteria bacterium]
MDEEKNLQQSPELQTSGQFEQLSNADAMSGIFTAPGETFETIANTPKKKLLDFTGSCGSCDRTDIHFSFYAGCRTYQQNNG